MFKNLLRWIDAEFWIHKSLIINEKNKEISAAFNSFDILISL